MQTAPLKNFQQTLPDEMAVSVIMQKKPAQNDWVDFSYQAVGVLPGHEQDERVIKRIHQQDGVEQYLCSGLRLRLHIDECESYYHNLMSPKPGCYVVADEVEDVNDMPQPYLVSLSFDEVHAYLEGDEQVYAVDIPAPLYQWVEAYILMHYVATRKTKRKLKNWKQQPAGGASVAPVKR